MTTEFTNVGKDVPHPNFDPKLIEILRKAVPRQMAEVILGVQPLDKDLFNNLRDVAMSEKDLIAQGYRPVSRLGLMWTKDEEE